MWNGLGFPSHGKEGEGNRNANLKNLKISQVRA